MGTSVGPMTQDAEVGDTKNLGLSTIMSCGVGTAHMPQEIGGPQRIPYMVLDHVKPADAKAK